MAAAPAIVPTSGGVLSAVSDGFLLWIAGGVIVILIMYGLLSRVDISARRSQE
jgi:hypothetical protein